MARIRQLGLAAASLAREQRVGIGRRLMRIVAPRFTVEIDRRISRIIWRLAWGGRCRAETLQAGPRVQQGAVDREMLVGQQPGLPRLIDHGIKECRGHIAFQQAVAVLTEGRRRPDLLVHAEADEPAKQDAVVDFFHQQPLAADRVQHLEQLGPQQFLGRNRGPPCGRVHRLE